MKTQVRKHSICFKLNLNSQYQYDCELSNALSKVRGPSEVQSCTNDPTRAYKVLLAIELKFCCDVDSTSSEDVRLCSSLVVTNGTIRKIPSVLRPFLQLLIDQCYRIEVAVGRLTESFIHLQSFIHCTSKHYPLGL